MCGSTCRLTRRSSADPRHSRANDSAPLYMKNPASVAGFLPAAGRRLALPVFAFFILVFAVFIVRRAGASGTEEQLAAIRIGNVSPVRAVAAVLGLVAGHDDRRADLEGIPGDAAPHQRVRRAPFDHPLF